MLKQRLEDVIAPKPGLTIKDFLHSEIEGNAATITECDKTGEYNAKV